MFHIIQFDCIELLNSIGEVGYPLSSSKMRREFIFSPFEWNQLSSQWITQFSRFVCLFHFTLNHFESLWIIIYDLTFTDVDYFVQMLLDQSKQVNSSLNFTSKVSRQWITWIVLKSLWLLWKLRFPCWCLIQQWWHPCRTQECLWSTIEVQLRIILKPILEIRKSYW